MSALAFTDCKVYVGGYDLSGQLNQAALEYAAETLDETTFGATTRINKGGVKSAIASVEGLWDSASATAIDPVIQARIGTADLPTILVPQGATVGNIAYLFRTLGAKYDITGTYGDLLKVSVGLPGSDGTPGLVRGKLFYSSSATGDVTGTAIQLGAVAAGKKLYAALHVFSGDGDFTVKVQSDDNSGFTSATDRITFTQVGTATAVASEWSSVSGSVTDDYWRMVATNPSTRSFAVALGIL